MRAWPIPTFTALLSVPARLPDVRNAFTDEVSLEALRRQQAEFVAERDWEQFHTPRSLALALVGEVGEVCECLQWRGDDGAPPGLPDWADSEREALADELADVLSYVIRIADVTGVDLPAAFLAKLEKNRNKYPAGMVRGSAKKYSQYRDRDAAAGGSSPPATASAQLEVDPAVAPAEAEAEERMWGTPQRVLDAQARAAARFAPQEESSPAKQPASPPPFPGQKVPSSPVSEQQSIPIEQSPTEPKGSFAQRAAAKAERQFKAMQAAQQQAGTAQEAPSVSRKEFEVESLDELFGFMEFGDGPQ
jgi:dCTP diphosphatase